MARVWVFQCSEGRVTYTVTLSQNQYGACRGANKIKMKSASISCNAMFILDK